MIWLNSASDTLLCCAISTMELAAGEQKLNFGIKVNAMHSEDVYFDKTLK